MHEEDKALAEYSERRWLWRRDFKLYDDRMEIDTSIPFRSDFSSLAIELAQVESKPVRGRVVDPHWRFLAVLFGVTLAALYFFAVKDALRARFPSPVAISVNGLWLAVTLGLSCNACSRLCSLTRQALARLRCCRSASAKPASRHLFKGRRSASPHAEARPGRQNQKSMPNLSFNTDARSPVNLTLGLATGSHV